MTDYNTSISNFDGQKIPDAIVTPVWIYDVDNYRICWANSSALSLWNAANKQDLYQRDLSTDISQATDRQLQQLAIDVQEKSQSIWWTLYPNNTPKQTYIRFSSIDSTTKSSLLLCEATVTKDEVECSTSFNVGKNFSSLYDKTGKLISCNPNFKAFYGDGYLDFFEVLEMELEQLNQQMAGKNQIELERQIIAKGRIYWFNFQIKFFVSDNKYLIVQENITERKTQEHKFLHLAYHDQLTGLLNRYGLEEFLNFRCQNKAKFYLFLLNIDAFKLINNNLGHKVGDAVLVATAKRLVKQLPAKYHLGRYGGDEFIVIVPADDDTQSVEAIIQLIIDTIALPLIELDSIQLTASIGTATFPDDAKDPTSLIMYADTAMYKAKELGSRSYCSFAKQMSLEIQRRSALQQGLKQALLFEELIPLYQPIVNMKTNELIGMEALLSWDSPLLGSVAPQEFVPEAERSGMMNDIGQWILTKACQQCLIWHHLSGKKLSLSVNVSAIELTDVFIDTLDEVLVNTGFPATSLILELTESIFLLNINQVIKRLKTISSRGIRICIDDFGTGYSSLSYIHKLPIDAIKIDRSFIADIDSSDVVIEATIAMANKLNLKVVAEGIENQHQLERMLRYPNLLAQGFYYSRPVNAQDFEHLSLFNQLKRLKNKNQS